MSSSPSSRVDRIAGDVQSLLEQVSGNDVAVEQVASTFFDLGLDSLLLTQLATAASKRFGVKLKLRNLAEDFPSCQTLAEYLDRELPASAYSGAPATPAAPTPAPPMAQQATTSGSVDGPPAQAAAAGSLRASAVTSPRPLGARRAAGSAVEELVRQQLALMSRQLEMLTGMASGEGTAPVATTATTAQPAPVLLVAAPQAVSAPVNGSAVPAPAPSPAPKEAQAPLRGHGPQLVIDRSEGSDLTPTQRKHFQRLIERYTAKTRKSKEFTQRNRKQIADPRTVSGFRPKMKELVYPLVAERSSGCHIWDLDGNDYVDLLNGYGSNFFGFGAPFIQKAIAKQLKEGMEIGPQTHLVEEVATLFREFVPVDRVAFCNTGSEAVLATMRLARTVTGRDLIVIFAGAYHGMFDEVIVRPTKRKSMPAAPGIPESAVENILVLPWAAPESLEIIRARGADIAAVLVEPVQSRAPDIQPTEFLKSLRVLTTEIGAALIFDEVVCGFRVAPGGAQEYFGIQADLGSYGKVLGGGLSIGVVAGKREYMDALDGGDWQFGDASTPEVGVTYFAGTFVRHPLILAAARAALLYMKKEGPDLQRRMATMTTNFANTLNTLFKEQGVPLEIRHFSSFMKIAHTAEIPYGEIIFCHLRERGVHVWDGRPCFFTAAHTEKDVAFIVEAFKGAVADMQEGGFYARPIVQIKADAPPVPGARLGRDRDGNPAWFVPDPANPTRYQQVQSP